MRYAVKATGGPGPGGGELQDLVRVLAGVTLAVMRPRVEQEARLALLRLVLRRLAESGPGAPVQALSGGQRQSGRR